MTAEEARILAGLKANYRQHRGLSPDHRVNYFEWYFYLKNR